MEMIKGPYKLSKDNKAKLLIEACLAETKDKALQLERLNTLMRDAKDHFPREKTVAIINLLKDQLKKYECIDIMAWQKDRETLDFRLRIAGDLLNIEDEIKTLKDVSLRFEGVKKTLEFLPNFLKRRIFPADPITQRKLRNSLSYSLIESNLSGLLRFLVSHQTEAKNFFGQVTSRKFSWPTLRDTCDPILLPIADFSYYQYLVEESAKNPKDVDFQKALMQAREWVDLEPVPLTFQQRQEELLKLYITLKKSIKASGYYARSEMTQAVKDSIFQFEKDVDASQLGFCVLSLDSLSVDFVQRTDLIDREDKFKHFPNWIIDDCQLMRDSYRTLAMRAAGLEAEKNKLEHSIFKIFEQGGAAFETVLSLYTHFQTTSTAYRYKTALQCLNAKGETLIDVMFTHPDQQSRPFTPEDRERLIRVMQFGTDPDQKTYGYGAGVIKLLDIANNPHLYPKLHPSRWHFIYENIALILRSAAINNPEDCKLDPRVQEGLVTYKTCDEIFMEFNKKETDPLKAICTSVKEIIKVIGNVSYTFEDFQKLLSTIQKENFLQCYFEIRSMSQLHESRFPLGKAEILYRFCLMKLEEEASKNNIDLSLTARLKSFEVECKAKGLQFDRYGVGLISQPLSRTLAEVWIERCRGHFYPDELNLLKAEPSDPKNPRDSEYKINLQPQKPFRQAFNASLVKPPIPEAQQPLSSSSSSLAPSPSFIPFSKSMREEDIPTGAVIELKEMKKTPEKLESSLTLEPSPSFVSFPKSTFEGENTGEVVELREMKKISEPTDRKFFTGPKENLIDVAFTRERAEALDEKLSPRLISLLQASGVSKLFDALGDKKLHVSKQEWMRENMILLLGLTDKNDEEFAKMPSNARAAVNVYRKVKEEFNKICGKRGKEWDVCVTGGLMCGVLTVEAPAGYSGFFSQPYEKAISLLSKIQLENISKDDTPHWKAKHLTKTYIKMSDLLFAEKDPLSEASIRYSFCLWRLRKIAVGCGIDFPHQVKKLKEKLYLHKLDSLFP
ncbi:MAG: hypothetical protein QM752_05705 [Gammaproteobacteria bacterium]